MSVPADPSQVRFVPNKPRDPLVLTLAALACGLCLTLIVDGYSFGQSNHGVYLLDSVRVQDPTLLLRDWFTANTLQYHLSFTWITYFLRSIGLLSTGFFLGYVVLVLLMHAAWLGITRRLGGNAITYLVGIHFFYILAGGLGLGMYRFMQDGSFLPSNVASAMTLVSLYFFISRRWLLAAVATATAGSFHLNYAVVGFVVWAVVAVMFIRRAGSWRACLAPRPILLACVALLPCGFNVLNATIAMWSQVAKLPLAEFVDLYARLRHPHHYDPSSWPTVIWVCFLLPIPVALCAFGLNWKSQAWRTAAVGVGLVLFLQLIALLGAGVYYVSDTLVQMSLWRFSVIAKAVCCIASAWLLMDKLKMPPRVVAGVLLAIGVAAVGSRFLPFHGDSKAFIDANQMLFLTGSVAMLCTACVLLRSTWLHYVPPVVLLAFCLYAATDQTLGPRLVPEDEPELIELARWSKANTPRDALFIIPPQDSLFRLESHRAAAISFKQVPQLSGELPEWRRRLERVLGMPDARDLKRPMYLTMRDIRERYAALPAGHFVDVAKEFQAQYVITAVKFPVEQAAPMRLIHAGATGKYFIYATGIEVP